jgi:hypothetical protein
MNLAVVHVRTKAACDQLWHRCERLLFMQLLYYRPNDIEDVFRGTYSYSRASVW